MSMLDRLFSSQRDWPGWSERHECPEEFPDVGDEDYGYGEAITSIRRSDRGTWWAWAGSEYASPVRFCPLCGLNLQEEATR